MVHLFWDFSLWLLHWLLITNERTLTTGQTSYRIILPVPRITQNMSKRLASCRPRLPLDRKRKQEQCQVGFQTQQIKKNFTAQESTTANILFKGPQIWAASKPPKDNHPVCQALPERRSGTWQGRFQVEHPQPEPWKTHLRCQTSASDPWGPGERAPVPENRTWGAGEGTLQVASLIRTWNNNEMEWEQIIHLTPHSLHLWSCNLQLTWLHQHAGSAAHSNSSGFHQEIYYSIPSYPTTIALASAGVPDTGSVFRNLGSCANWHGRGMALA